MAKYVTKKYFPLFFVILSFKAGTYVSDIAEVHSFSFYHVHLKGDKYEPRKADVLSFIFVIHSSKGGK